nr:MAG TPA: PcfK-like protein [Caudoviricetes sp.]
MVDKVKEVIKAHLDAMAQKDERFAERYANHGKSIDECMDYILGEARKRGRTVYMSDQEVFGMAAHYYEEDGIKVSKLGSSVKATATINDDPAELTDEEKAKIKKEAVEAYRQQCLEAEAAAVRKREKKRREAKQNAMAQKQSGYVGSLFG